MTTSQFTQWRSIAWKSSAAAAASIFLTSIYFAIILPLFGFTFEMLDDHVAAINWYVKAKASGVFQGLMICYFISQLVLLPVPFALHNLVSKTHNSVYSFYFALLGTAGVIIAMAGPIFIFANIPELANAAVKGMVPVDILVMTGNMFADLTKDFRLFSEILLGIWLMGFGFMISKSTAHKVKSLIIGVFGITVFVIPAIKLADPYMHSEDYIGLVLAGCFILLSIVAYKSKPEEIIG
ncbi:hypothetical protein [Aquimarina sp. MMG016]|uniref:hypothetical protein n=1 Tax=Aquimarina sp. MMG016 TaxID=2822690 RepID=UPI001B39EF03|nr:hypothetical protein [Aquimarina sp. MMG016]MBQ4820750.1 hypothetical protein [Aquimarina sp. MMG016]